MKTRHLAGFCQSRPKWPLCLPACLSSLRALAHWLSESGASLTNRHSLPASISTKPPPDSRLPGCNRFWSQSGASGGGCDPIVPAVNTAENTGFVTILEISPESVRINMELCCGIPYYYTYPERGIHLTRRFKLNQQRQDRTT